jgi:hypothetical protein
MNSEIVTIDTVVLSYEMVLTISYSSNNAILFDHYINSYYQTHQTLTL